MSSSDCGYEQVSTVYIGHDNAVTVVPYSDISARTYYDMTTASQVTASADLTSSIVGGDNYTASSDDIPTTIWWEQVGTTEEWRIHLKVGLFVGIPAGEYTLRIIIIDATHTNGLVLTDTTRVDVVGAP